MESKLTPFTFRRADWDRDCASVRKVREAVFVKEQNVPPELEWDGIDPKCVHIVAEVNGVAIGTGRLLPDGHIGRMAVLPQWRGQGVGTVMLNMLLDIARKNGLKQIVLHAQSHALDFYTRAGCRPVGEEFMEAGIAHRQMIKVLD